MISTMSAASITTNAMMLMRRTDSMNFFALMMVGITLIVPRGELKSIAVSGDNSFVAYARAWLDPDRIRERVAGYDLQWTIAMPGAPALLGTVLFVQLLEEVRAGHGLGCHGVFAGKM